jgi:hypothetical protein
MEVDDMTGSHINTSVSCSLGDAAWRDLVFKEALKAKGFKAL